MKTIIGYIGTIMASLVFTVATLSVSASAQSGHPRSYYPTLTPDDISVCRAEFAAVQADVVQHLRLTAAHYRPGGVYSRGCPECNSEQIATYTNMANRVQTMDPVSFYVEGFRGDGEGVGDLAAWNGFDGEFSLQIHQRNLTEDVEPEGLDDLEYSIVRSQVQRAADRCVARIWMAKLNLMHQQVAAGRTEPGPLGLQDMPVGSSGSASAPTSSLAATATAAPSAENVFGECYRLEGPDRSGIQTIWQL
ncbi:MAG TPA: hypothetical protein VFO69_03380, partial [Allosphingosinicella sp.]|nr:hypothetical protein [Allosphingosinicella sp.]